MSQSPVQYLEGRKSRGPEWLPCGERSLEVASHNDPTGRRDLLTYYSDRQPDVLVRRADSDLEHRLPHKLPRARSHPPDTLMF